MSSTRNNIHLFFSVTSGIRTISHDKSLLKSAEQVSCDENQGNIIDFGNEILSSVAETCEWD